MLSIQYAGAGAHIDRLKQLAIKARVKPLAAMQRIGRTVVQGNKLDREEGIQADGTPMPPLKTRRIGVYAGATGPPLAPFADTPGRRSKSISLFEYEIRGFTGGLLLVCGWRDGPPRPGSGGGRRRERSMLRILKWHSRGESGVGVPYYGKDGQIKGYRGIKGRVSGIKRDIFGISPRSWKLIKEAIVLSFDGWFR